MKLTTVDDKIKLFAKVVFEKVQKESDLKVIRFTAENDKYLEEEKDRIMKESQAAINQAKKKAETKKNEIISKANMEGQHELLRKRKELYDQAVDDIRKMAESYTLKPEYAGYLEGCIREGLSRIDARDIVIYLKPEDILNFGNKINEMADRYKTEGSVVSIKETTMDILGGCILEDGAGTMRVDCSMSSAIDENRSLIGKELMDNLQ